MTTFVLLARQQGRLLLFGFLLAFFSGFGQTFLVSLYVPELARDFALSNTQLSGLYAAATLAGAFTLPWVGRYVDLWPLARYAGAVLLALAGALLVLSAAAHPAFILLGFWGMRLTGQGLMSHTAMTAITRGFEGGRGKAIGLATLGHPAGEAVLPLLVASLIATTGWRYALQGSAALLLVLILPLIWWLLQPLAAGVTDPARHPGTAGAPVARPSAGGLLRGRAFWILTPAIFLWGFVNTAVFFFQIPFGAARGWDPRWVAGSLAAFAAANALAMVLGGTLVDRWTARRTYALFPVPQLLGLTLLATIHHPLAYPAGLFLMGLSNGAGSTMFNAVLAEVYGTAAIGAVRSLFATMLVLSTALGPVVWGALLDRGIPFDGLLLGAAALVAASVAWSRRVGGLG